MMILIVGSVRDVLLPLAAGLRARGLNTIAVEDGSVASSILALNTIDAVVVHLRHCASPWIASLAQRARSIPVIALVAPAIDVDSDDFQPLWGLEELGLDAVLLPDSTEPDEIAERLDAQQREQRAQLIAVGLEDILNLLAMTNSDATLDIVRGHCRGRMLVQQGEIVHAEREHREGLEVAYEIADWPEPQVTIQSFASQSLGKTSLRMSASLLLHEAAVRRGELVRIHELPQVQEIFARLSASVGVRAVALVHTDREEVVVAGGPSWRSLKGSMVRWAAETVRGWASDADVELEPGSRGLASWRGTEVRFVTRLDYQLALCVVADARVDISRVQSAIVDHAGVLASLTTRKATMGFHPAAAEPHGLESSRLC